jgi:hypothetical protein
MAHWMQIVSFLKDKEETDALAALMRVDSARLNEVMAVFRRFIKSAEGNSVSYSNIFPMLEKLMANLGALRANKHAEALMNAVLRRFSETTDVNIIFACFLVTPIGKRYYGVVMRPSEVAASMETMWKKGVATLSKALHYDVAQITSLFQDYLDNPCWFHSVKELCTNWHRRVSMSGRQRDTDSFVDLVKRIEALPATECACERLFCQLRNLVGDFRHQMSDSMIVDLLVIKTRIIWPNAAQIQERAEVLKEVQPDTVPDQTATQYRLVRPNTTTPGKCPSFQSPLITTDEQLWKQP